MEIVKKSEQSRGNVPDIFRLLSKDDQLTNDGPYIYNYDLSGRLLSKTTSGVTNESHVYNWMDRTTRIVVSGVTNEYQFDTLGRRISKQEGASSIISNFFDGDDCYREYDSAGSEYASYIFSGRVDEPLVMKKGGVVYTYHQDHLGTVVGLSDEDESVVNEYKYTAYGKSRVKSEGVSQPYEYTARENVGETELYYYRPRVYDAGSGRFVMEDDWYKEMAVRNNAKRFVEINWYKYVLGNPIILKDSYGYGSDEENLINGLGCIGATCILGLGGGVAWLIGWYIGSKLAKMDPTYVNRFNYVYF
jgi:RHS repeat-associated protein